MKIVLRTPGVIMAGRKARIGRPLMAWEGRNVAVCVVRRMMTLKNIMKND
ncbi:MAG: hypothetical protein OEZ28_14750 [Nitrospinota bacterium]|nr:hypothetical protein [Nitrospinota bacterium]